MTRVALVSCVKSKLSRPAPARELYTSQLFRGFRALAERDFDRWFILSARFGLVEPSRVIPPYELTLNTFGMDARREWSKGVLQELERELPLEELADVTFFAGARYREFLVGPLCERGHIVDCPLEGLGMGLQLQYLARHAR